MRTGMAIAEPIRSPYLEQAAWGMISPAGKNPAAIHHLQAAGARGSPLLTEEQHCRNADENGDDLVKQLVQEDRQGLHRRGIAQQQRHQEVVGVLHDRNDFLW